MAPDGWRLLRIGDFAKVSTGGTPARSEPELWHGSVPWMSSGEIHARRVRATAEHIGEAAIAESNAKWLPAGCVMIALNGQGRTRGKAAITEIPLTCNQSLAAVHPSKEVLPDFLLQFLETRYEFIRGLTGDQGRNGLNLDLVRGIEVPVPPLAEQRKIAAILSSVDETIEKTEAVIAQLDVVKKAMLEELLTRGIPGRHSRFKQTEIGEVPETWRVSKILDVIALPSGQVDPTQDPFRNWPLVAPNHIESGTGKLSAVETAEQQGAISGKYRFDAGDVIYSKIRPYLQKAAIAPWPGLCSADMYPMKVGPSLRAEILLAVLLSERFTAFATSVSMRTGIPKINREELATFTLAIPPLEEQDRIGAALASVQSRAVAEGAELTALRDVKAALSQSLLSGQLRVAASEVTA